MKYDAFISYRHGDLDGLVAEKLHKMLETYRIPSAIAKKVGKKKLARVFRDREELPTSSNLSDSINYALENSAFLLLICSRRTCQSQWVMREVERFGDLHGKDRIIALLIDGEPDESFPPGLRERKVGDETIFVEPLAADIRANTWAKSIKLLKEEKLRLLSPILGCAFDDLRRRHRRRKIQRIVSVVSATFAFTVSFGVFSTWQYIQIDRQMQLKLENQSYVLAEYSAGELAAGDRDTALLLALAALPENLSKPERPLVSAAQRALSDGVGIYDVSEGFKPHKVLSLPVAPSKVLLSPDEKYAAVLYPFELMLSDTESGNTAVLLPTVNSVLADVEFLSDNTVVFSGENGIEAYNYARGELLWQGRFATSIAVSGDKTVIAAVFKDEEFAVLYRADGKELGEISFHGRTMRIPVEGSFLNPHDTLFELNGDGTKLAVSFQDGSLSVFDTDTYKETPVYPEGNAIHFAGGFLSDILAFSVVENEPYYSGYFVLDSKTGKSITKYESATSRFLPLAGSDGLYVAFENQIMSVDTETGDISHVESAGGRVEAFKEGNDAFIICETEGDYYFTGHRQAYQSDYTCHFADIESVFALTGSYDSKEVRILRSEDGKGSELMNYDRSYGFSEAKINSSGNRAVFYSYSGMRICDLNGNIIAEIEFPNPMEVLDTRYDKQSGNIAVLYKSALRLYSGTDGSLMLEQQGKQGTDSVLYTDFGVSVLRESGDISLYDLSTGQISVSENITASSDSALPIGGGLLVVENGSVYFDGREIGKGKLIGANKTGENDFSFAVSDGENGVVFTLSGNTLSENFTFHVFGEAEAYFCGGYVWISPSYGYVTVYDMKSGKLIRVFEENGFLSETVILGEYIAADYVSAMSRRYTFLLHQDTLEAVAYLPGFLGELDSGTLVFDDNNGRLCSVKLYNLEELTAMAKERLDGRVLSSEEIKKYKAG